MRDNEWFQSMAENMLEYCGIEDVDGPEYPANWLKKIYNIGFSDGIKNSEETMDDRLKYAIYE